MCIRDRFYLLPLILFGIAAFLFKNKNDESLLLSFDFLGNILGALVGGLFAFWIAYIQIKDQRKQQDEQRQDQIKQQDDQRKLEIKKMKAELEIQNLEFQDKLLRDLDSVLNTYCLTYLKTNSFASNFDNSDSPIPKKTETIINCLYPEIRATLIVDNSVPESNVCKLISKLDNFLDGSSDTIKPSEAAECRNLISEIFKENAQKKRNIIDSIQK